LVSEWKTRLSFNGPKPDECSGWFLMNTTFAVLHVLTATKRLETTTAKPVPLARRQMAVPSWDVLCQLQVMPARYEQSAELSLAFCAAQDSGLSRVYFPGALVCLCVRGLTASPRRGGQARAPTNAGCAQFYGGELLEGADGVIHKPPAR
jgi:hypothetical protein